MKSSAHSRIQMTLCTVINVRIRYFACILYAIFMVFARFASDARLANRMLRIKVNPATIDDKSEIRATSILFQFNMKFVRSKVCHRIGATSTRISDHFISKMMTK